MLLAALLEVPVSPEAASRPEVEPLGVESSLAEARSEVAALLEWPRPRSFALDSLANERVPKISKR